MTVFLYQVTSVLLFHDFVYPNAGDEWIVVGDLFRVFKALGIDDRVARDGVYPHCQIL